MSSRPPDIALVGQDPGLGGGALTQMEALWRACLALGRDPELLHLRYPRLPPRETELRGRSVGPLVPNLDAANQLAAALRLAPAVRRARSAFVVSTVASSGFAARLGGRAYGCWIGTSLDDEWRSRSGALDPARRLALRLNGPALRRLERAVLRGATVRWATSPAARRSVARAAGLPEAAFDVVPIPVDPERWRPLPEAEWRARLARPELVFVGRAADPRKNVRLLLDALPEIRARVPTARLTLVGEPPPWPLPEGARATGVVDSVAEHVRSAALLVLPSLQEGFGLVVAEALAAGVPVLVTPSGGPEELVRASGGGVVLDGFDRAGLVERAAALLGEPDTLLAMRTRGRAHVLAEHAPERLQAALDAALSRLDAGG